MRDQYAGDVSDVIKFAFLRALARQDRTLGVAWYYVPGNDGSQDGQHLEWMKEPAWRSLDGELQAGLSSLPERSVAALERAPIWPTGTCFHRAPVPAGPGRREWCAGKRTALGDADLVFLDPDKGVGEASAEHAAFAEVEALRRPGRSIVFIKFPGRTKHDDQVRQLHQRLRDETGTASILTLRTNISVPSKSRPGLYVQRQRWFTVVDADVVLTARSKIFASSLSAVPRVRAQIDF